MPTGIHRNLKDMEISDGIRRNLQEKRITMGLPLKSVAAVLGVDWSTIRKWETGKTKHCSITVRPRLERFLNGDYDALFASNLPPIGRVAAEIDADTKDGIHLGAYDDATEQDGDVAATILRGAMMACTLCQKRPEVHRRLLQQIERATIAALAKLAQ